MAFLLSGDYSRAIPVVSSFFTIKDLQRNQREDSVRFLVAESDIRETLPAFLKELGKLGMIASASRSRYVRKLMPTLSSVRLSVDDGIVLTVSKMPRPRARKKGWLPVPLFLFMATVAIVFFDGALFRSQWAFANAFIEDPFMLGAIYTISLMGILGIHELGHMVAARKHGIKTSWPYFIPGIPGFIPYFIPTFGAMIQIRANMTNRNVLFDVGIAGPIAGLIITIIVSIYGSSLSVLIPADQAGRMLDGVQILQLPRSILMVATQYLTGSLVEGAVLVWSPILFAAWLGFLITFLNLMPAWQLDGGHLARAALGVRWHRTLTYSSVAVLFGLGFFPMALLVLFFSLRAPESTPLDDVTPLSRGRKMLFVVALGLAVVCAPLPPDFFTAFA